MNNPFQEIVDRLINIESSLADLKQSAGHSAPQPETQPLSVAQAAQFLRLTTQTVYDKVHKGTLPHVKRGNRIYFFQDELMAWLKSGRQQTQEALQAQATTTMNTTLLTRRRKGGRTSP